MSTGEPQPRVFNESEKRSKAAALFSHDCAPDELSDCKHLTNELEKNMTLQLKAWWNATTLEEYAGKCMIPRGLRIKKSPTFQTN